MSYSPLANISPADISAFKNYQSLPSEQQGAKLQDMIGNGFDWGKLIALKNQADKIKAKEQADMVAYQAQQAGGAPPPMGQNSTVADDLQAQIRAALYPQQQQMPQQMAQGQMPPQEQMPPQQMAQGQPAPQMPTQQMAHGGLAHLPVSNFRNENYAGGGIVAFGDPELNPEEQQLVEKPSAYAEAMRKNALSQGIGSQLVPEVKNLKRGLGMIGDRIGSEVADVVGMPGQIAYDWDHYNRTKAASKDDTGQLLHKFQTQGFMPITADLPDRQAAARDFPDSSQRSVPNVMGVPTKPATKAAAPTSGPKYDAFAGAFPGAARLVSTPTPGATDKTEAGVGAGKHSGDMYESQSNKSGLPAVTNAAKAAAKAKAAGVGTGADAGADAGTGTGTKTPAISAAQKTINDTLARAKQIEDDVTKNAPAITSREQRDADVEKRHNEALIRNGISPQAHQEAIAELKDQAITARKNRDTDHLMAAAAGFFSMAGGTSPYALKNMADGFGVTVKNVTEAEKYYRESEKARKASLAALQQSRRAEVLGLEDKKDAADTKYQALQEKHQDKLLDVAKSLRIQGTASQTSLENKQLGLAQIGAYHASTQAAREAETARRTEADRGRNYIGQQNALTGMLKQLETARANVGKEHGMVGLQLDQAKTPEAQQKLLATPAGQAYVNTEKRFGEEEAKIRERLTNLHTQYGGGGGQLVKDASGNFSYQPQ